MWETKRQYHEEIGSGRLFGFCLSGRRLAAEMRSLYDNSLQHTLSLSLSKMKQ